MLRTQICDALGIEHPVFQGGMARISDASLAAAVSNAGGLGIISAMSGDGEWLRAEIRRARELTARPFGVNIMLMSRRAEAAACVCAEERVPVVTTGAGSCAKYMSMWQDAGVRVIPVVASVAMAKMARRAGAFAVIAEGEESGGHIGELTTMALVPQVCDAVDIPVLAAGGIADGRGLAAALMLGAAGVQMGTRFLLAEECTVHPNYKHAVLKATDISTAATGRRFSGAACRSIKNDFTRALSRLEYAPDTTAEEFNEKSLGALSLAAREGDTKGGSVMAGQCAGLVRREQTAREILAEVTGGAERLLKGASAWLR